MSLNALLTQLVDEEYLTSDAEASIAAALANGRAETETPWYVKALIGVAAWLAAIFLVAALGIAGLIEVGMTAIATGGVFVAGALILAWRLGHGIFWGQLAFALSLAGQLLVIGGVLSETSSIAAAALVAIGLETVLFVLYPDGLHRLLSLLALCAALLALMMEWDAAEAVHLLITVLALGAVLVWQYAAQLWVGRWASFQMPLGIGLPLALFLICVLSLVDGFEATLWWLSALGLAVVLLYLGSVILIELGIGLRSAVGIWFVAAVVLIAIPAYQTPGILAAIIGLLLGFWRGNRLLLGAATLFLLGFLAAYYYNLTVTLLVKSFILMGTGVVLLLLRTLLLRITGGAGTNDAMRWVLDDSRAVGDGGSLGEDVA